MDVDIKVAYQHACAALGEQLVLNRLLEAENARLRDGSDAAPTVSPPAPVQQFPVPPIAR